MLDSHKSISANRNRLGNVTIDAPVRLCGRVYEEFNKLQSKPHANNQEIVKSTVMVLIIKTLWGPKSSETRASEMAKVHILQSGDQKTLARLHNACLKIPCAYIEQNQEVNRNYTITTDKL